MDTLLDNAIADEYDKVIQLNNSAVQDAICSLPGVKSMVSFEYDFPYSRDHIVNNPLSI